MKPHVWLNYSAFYLSRYKGGIVELLADGAAFEVEFSDSNGQTYESVGLPPEQIMVLYFESISPNLVPEIVTA
ncbi:DUF4926 domain-containing protein [Umezakia ovalisporum]|jgi:hypothetical protein|uniref:DUF4926 domain-containing protein n=2 Tax=Umezakia ovalisporum TaxID=75695 RepID=A0AA43GWM8_9CYAN|nr:DUF4926 domain-containing protein [Umezakia ovalisporum]MBI1241007.1 DUF4926 domain-containing protein [Nostoc sp. RI_552]MDH6055875.1 DUF4926 domain-containing protein [Umezakia ovalisporum FSS-43]MDH6063127.1 DUF4926 domain-containing protein [Umezakia ovalisporum FSS-62]MDH6068985.1 DUF4926 domain-containing protein [Umezakia ovalisporum APH033B]MDH6069694.1 DUF4926 domain-containing protein [Umezakia ovalisporum CobakiLakeA]